MSVEHTRPFDSIESAYEFIVLLEESIEDAVRDITDHVQDAKAEQDERRTEALTLALYKLSQLTNHTQRSRRALNDLRTIRRLLFQERSQASSAAD